MKNEEFKQFKTNFIPRPINDQLSELFSEMSTTPNQKVNEIGEKSK